MTAGTWRRIRVSCARPSTQPSMPAEGSGEMVFENRPASELVAEDIRQLLDDKVEENQHLDYKATYVLGDNSSKADALTDICAFANSTGGYLVVGVRDDGTGKPEGLSGLTQDDANRIVQSVQDAALDGIRDRVKGVECRELALGGVHVVVISVPESDRKPHMVVLHHWTKFCLRHDSTNREMTIEEIREAIVHRESDRIGVDVPRIVAALRGEMRNAGRSFDDRVQAALEGGPHTETDPVVLLVALRESLGGTYNPPDIQFVFVPATLVVGAIPVDADLVQIAGAMRRRGWTFFDSLRSIRPTAAGFSSTESYADSGVNVLDNGAIFARAPIDDHITRPPAGGPRPTNPSLFPLAVVEYPLSFATLVRGVVDLRTDGADAGTVHVYLRGVAGMRLAPYRPGIAGYEIGLDIGESEEDFHHIEVIVASGADPHAIAHQMVARIYQAFGHTPDCIPYWSVEDGVFDIPP